MTADRCRVVADVVRAEWTPLDGFEWTPEEVARVERDLAAGDLENHFHEAVPHIQFGLLTLERAASDGSSDDSVLIELAREFLPADAGRATPELVVEVRELRRERGDELELDPLGEYVRFGLRVLAHARGEDWNAPEVRRAFIGPLFRTR